MNNIEVELDYKLKRKQLKWKTELVVIKYSWYDLGVFKTNKDMRPLVFDFVTSKWFKTLQLNQKKIKI
jgi:hypothetical protein